MLPSHNPNSTEGDCPQSGLEGGGRGIGIHGEKVFSPVHPVLGWGKWRCALFFLVREQLKASV